MNFQAKKILYLDLNKWQCDIKLHEDYGKYLGGVGLGAKILTDFPAEEDTPVVFSTGPLNGFFPYASKTSILFKDKTGLKDLYIGGALSNRIRFCGLDAIVIFGKSKEPVIIDVLDEMVNFRKADIDIHNLGLPGKRVIAEVKNDFFVGNYFEVGNRVLSDVLKDKNLSGLVLTGSRTFEIPDREKYSQIYENLMSRMGELSVEKDGHPSCSGCPMGCAKSRIGEVGGNALVHSLVACQFADSIYSDVNTVFSCLDALGYGYTHEDIENFSPLVYDLLEGLKK